MFRSILLTFLCSAAISAHAATISYDFDDGTLQGWQVIQDGTPLTFSVSNASGNSIPVPTSGAYQVIPDAFNGRDGAHDTLLIRSPEFYLDGSGNLTISIAGGQGSGTSQATLPGSPSDLAPNTGGTGTKAMGIGLRRVSDSSYVLTAQKAGNGNAYETLTLTSAQLATHVSGTETYTVDVYDSFGGGWGWITMDTVNVPGVIPEPSTGLLGLLGAILLLHRRRA